MEKIKLDDFCSFDSAGHSSKGNQLKWKCGNKWYKADHMGYEGLAEVAVSGLLVYSNVENYVVYEPVQIQYKGKEYNGCVSENFLREDEEATEYNGSYIENIRLHKKLHKILMIKSQKQYSFS